MQNLEQVVNDTKERTKVDPPQRIRWEFHNFFQAQPIQDARVYLLRFILYDYSDKYAAEVLRAIVPAISVESKVSLFDGLNARSQYNE